MNAGPTGDFPPADEARLDARDAALWQVLGRAPMSPPDAWFVTRALARCRTEKRAALVRVWRWALGGGLGVCLAVTLLVAQVTHVKQVHRQKLANQKNVQEAFEIMASIDNSPTSSDTDSPGSPSSWQDSSL